MTSQNSFEILTGTYEEFVLGYQLIKSEDSEKDEYSLSQTFVTHSHQASVRSIAATSKIVASSGADETVVLYDMILRKQSGALMQHEGTITCLKFTPEGSHLISCSDDGSIAIFRVGSWQLEKLFKKAHKGTAVNHIAIHPSGKLALSVGKDKTLRTWNLVKGRSAYTTNLSSYGIAYENLDCVIWSPEGEFYAIPIQTKAIVFSVEKGGIQHTIKSSSKVNCVCFLNESTLCIGNEESHITAHNLTNETELWSIKVSSSRVKSLITYEKYLVAITSAGDLKVWEFDADDITTEPKKLAELNDGCRFTCLTIRPRIQVDTPESISKKKKNKNQKKVLDDIITTPIKERSDEIEEINIDNQNKKKENGIKKNGIKEVTVTIGGQSKTQMKKKNSMKAEFNIESKDDESEEEEKTTKKSLKRKSTDNKFNSNKITKMNKRKLDKDEVKEEYVDISTPSSIKKKKIIDKTSTKKRKRNKRKSV